MVDGDKRYFNGFTYHFVLYKLQNNRNLSRVLEIVWLKKLYLLIFYTLKHEKEYKVNTNFNIYNINDESIDFGYFNELGETFSEKEVLEYLSLLKDFINNNLYLTNYETNYYNEQYNKYKIEKNEESRFYRGFLQNYFELEIFLIIISLKSAKIENNRKICSEIEDILNLYKMKSFYFKNIYKYHYHNNPNDFNRNKFNFYIINESKEDILPRPFYFYTFDQYFHEIHKYLQIYELKIIGFNKNRSNEENSNSIKELINKNLIINCLLFGGTYLNGYKESQINNLHRFRGNTNYFLEKEDFKIELFNFLFVPIQKETLNKYLQIADNIYSKSKFSFA